MKPIMSEPPKSEKDDGFGFDALCGMFVLLCIFILPISSCIEDMRHPERWSGNQGLKTARLGHSIGTYYYMKEGSWVLKHDPRAEQEGGLRTTGNPNSETSAGWIGQFN